MLNTMMNLLPAVLVGGPPNSGKSVLAYHLAQALYAQRVPCYLYRAAPDGEGNWFAQSNPALARMLRLEARGPWTERWVQLSCQHLADRRMPLIVDIGGRPRPDQLAMFDQCTHAVVISRDEEARHTWLALARQHNLRLIADLHSDLHGEPHIETTPPEAGRPLRATITGLDRTAPVLDAVFAAVVARVAKVVNLPGDTLRRVHMAAAPFDLDELPLVDFDVISQALHPTDPHHHFVPEDIPGVLAQIPTGVPIAVYGRVNVAMLAAVAQARDIAWQFDVRLGWVQPPVIRLATDTNAEQHNAAIQLTRVALATGRYRLDVERLRPPLELHDTVGLVVPAVERGSRVLLNKPFPLWLLTALVKAYRGQAEVSAYQPQWAEGKETDLRLPAK